MVLEGRNIHNQTVCQGVVPVCLPLSQLQWVLKITWHAVNLLEINPFLTKDHPLAAPHGLNISSPNRRLMEKFSFPFFQLSDSQRGEYREPYSTLPTSQFQDWGRSIVRMKVRTSLKITNYKASKQDTGKDCWELTAADSVPKHQVWGMWVATSFP